MGIHRNIAHDRFPKQGSWLHRRSEVCFHYNPEHTLLGTVVRHDTEEPGLTIIRLDDGRYVLATECHHSWPPTPPQAHST